MRKTLLCLTIGVLSFYLGVYAQSLFYWEKMDVKIVDEVEESVYSVCPTLRNNDSQKQVKEDFEITEGDYYAGKNDEVTLHYFYSNYLNGDNSLDGQIEIDSTYYDVAPKSYFNPVSGDFQFKTEKKNKTQYVFTGKIIKNKYSEGENALQVQIKQIKNKKIVASVNHKFKFYYHVCSQ